MVKNWGSSQTFTFQPNAGLYFEYVNVDGISVRIVSPYTISFFFNDPATTEIYTTPDTLSLNDALPIRRPADVHRQGAGPCRRRRRRHALERPADRKSTRLNSSHRLLTRMPSSA